MSREKEIEARAWSALAQMETEAMALEEAARRLRERAAELRKTLDPTDDTKEKG